MPYIPFTQEQKERANRVDLQEYLLRQGEQLLPSGKEKRLARDHSITVYQNRWYDHAAEKGGGAISFLQYVYGYSYPEAISLLLTGNSGGPYAKARLEDKREKTVFTLPPAGRSMERVYTYLVRYRCIDQLVVQHFVKEKMIYEDKLYHNCVFVGVDLQRIPRHAHKRSTNFSGKAFRQNVAGSDPRYSFRYIGTEGLLYVFEAPIDLLSYLTLYPENWQTHSYVACCGVSSVPVLTILEQVPSIRSVVLCLDNDRAGRAAAIRMNSQIKCRFGIEAECIFPRKKDWNEDLQGIQQQK